jgi:hypothetical protein
MHRLYASNKVILSMGDRIILHLKLLRKYINVKNRTNGKINKILNRSKDLSTSSILMTYSQMPMRMSPRAIPKRIR